MVLLCNNTTITEVSSPYEDANQHYARTSQPPDSCCREQAHGQSELEEYDQWQLCKEEWALIASEMQGDGH